MSFILAIDQGTSSTRAFLFDEKGSVVSMAQQEIAQFYPHPGWVEQDALEIWESVKTTCKKCISQPGVQPESIRAIGITNQRETTIVWDKFTGKPVHRAIVWQSRQSLPYIEDLYQKNLSESVRRKTGLVPDAYFSASKISWILDLDPELRNRAEAGDLLFGTVDSWLLWKMTGLHATDVSNASRTMLFNIHERYWDQELLEWFGVPEAMLPEVRPSSGYFSETNKDFLWAGIPVCGIAGDQQSALFAQGCFKAGESKNTYGTGCFMLMNTGLNPVDPGNGLLSTIAWQIGEETTYALEGSVFTAGAALKWLRDGLGLFLQNDQIASLVSEVEDNGGLYFVPAFTGLGAPWWDSNARGAFFGVTAGTKPGHFVRAALEAMAFQTRDVFELMEQVSGIGLQVLRVDGGASASDMLMQFQSDLTGTRIERPRNIETTVSGAAMLAGIAAGIWRNKEEAIQIRQTDRKFEPLISSENRNHLIKQWTNAVKATRLFSS